MPSLPPPNSQKNRSVRVPVRPGGSRIEPATDEDLAENVFLPADRHMLQKLADSRKLLAEGRYG